nr:hypothetical protein [Tanacetum cinerariifolium]
MPPPADCKDDILETEMPPRKRLCLSTLGARYEVRESFTTRPTRGRGIDYGFVSTLYAEARRRGIREVGYELAELYEHDTLDLYALLEDAQESRTRISQRVVVDSQRVDLLMVDMIAHQETVQIVEDKQIMEPVTRQGPSTFPNNTNPNNMTPESVQAMIDQALLRNFTNGDGSHSLHEDNRRNVQTMCPCFYADFMKCQPLNFKGTEGVVGLTRWIEKIESVFQISGYAVENQVKFSTCTLLDAALTWWNSQIRSLGHDAYSMTWEVLKKKMTFKGTEGVVGLTRWIEKIESVFQISGYAVENQTPKRQNVASVYNIGTGERKPYSRNLPKCTNCHFHHNGPCTQKCHKCNKVGHFARDCRSSGNAKRDCPKLKNKDGEKVNAPGWVYAIGNAEKRGNASRDPDLNVVTGWVYAIGNAEKRGNASRDPDLNVVMGHPFNIDLMPVELGSFVVIIGMDWLRRCHAVIVCDEKLVRIPYGNETLTFHGNESSNGRESRLAVISCSKAQEYMAKGCQIFLAHISSMKEEDRTEGK